MASFAKMTLSALALQCAMLSGAIATAPLSDNVHTETAVAQEIGSMTSGGHLVYSMNYCTVIQTTECAVTMSTGAPVPESSSNVDGVTTDSASTVAYPAPSHDHGGGNGGESPSAPGEGAEPTSPAGDDGGASTATDAVGPSGSETASGSASETGGGATPTDGGEDATGTATDTAATGDATGAANVLGIGMSNGLIGLVSLAMAYML